MPRRETAHLVNLLTCRVCLCDFYEREFPNDILFCKPLASRWERFCEINQNDPGFSPLIFDEWLRFQRRKWRNFCGSCWRALEEDHGITLSIVAGPPDPEEDYSANQW